MDLEHIGFRCRGVELLDFGGINRTHFAAIMHGSYLLQPRFACCGLRV